ncbi:MAG: Glutamate N-acetyltransferase 2 [Alphaproteobacteria bacterium MarineAlpha11_Bin1]|nr:MAG: Glutamate N-acetyltransferase 2 [Alphaproteobacteria bacterium MarineAlpha11_Bin1]|tara:strand:+ start:38953 stop:40182 length:1230 start_codon:yes stop_codon:yes gene_type:complete
MPKKSPLAPSSFPDMPAIPGVRVGSASCGLKDRGRKDLFLAALDRGTKVGGVFTRSKTAAAPVNWCKRRVIGGQARALIVNAGNANAFTGRAGENSLQRTVEGVASVLKVPKSNVFVASTGVIGETLPDGKITKSLKGMIRSLSAHSWVDAASAIMTTDTFPKGAWRRVNIGETKVTIGGIAKGSGMIAPDMATMLAFVFTDAKIPASVLQTLTAHAADRSFNAITVDGDTSTSDTVLVFATGATKHEKISKPGDMKLRAFRGALEEVMTDLAHQIVRDGEGATKFVTINVTGARSGKSAKKIGLAIANSPLVKTAIAGEDANWGRIVMAVGKSGEEADRDRLTISIGGVAVADRGEVVKGYKEAPVTKHMKGSEIDINVDLNIGRGAAKVWTCDLTHGYISINADYRS